MGEEIFVVQVVTDGDYGFPLDRVCEIGICRVDIDTANVESVYSARVFLEPGSFTKKQKSLLVRCLLKKRSCFLQDIVSGIRVWVSAHIIPSLTVPAEMRDWAFLRCFSVTAPEAV